MRTSVLLTISFVLWGADNTLLAQEPQLSKAEQAIVAHEVAKMKTSDERAIVNSWSNAKKVAEFICRPAALRTLAKQDASIDKVFLGTNDPASLTLESAGRLTGSGQYRKGIDWSEIDFTCEVNPDTGKVASFQWVPAKNKAAQ